MRNDEAKTEASNNRLSLLNHTLCMVLCCKIHSIEERTDVDVIIGELNDPPISGLTKLFVES